jgi:dTDP-4-dehydrorhamnose 3,5-epimerase
MKSIFKEIKVFKPQVYFDKRGVFFESFDKSMSDDLNQAFTQDNHSHSYTNVIRGLHYQWNKPMGKLVRVAKGKIIDYFVDIRKDSVTYGQYDSIMLSDKNRVAVWIPPGFAHGFEVLENDTLVLYKCTAYYNKDGESGINPFDKEINIPWQVSKEKMIISDKDFNSQTFAEYSLDPKF